MSEAITVLERLHDGLREITEGLVPGDNIVVSGLQRVRPGAEVNPQAVPMPSLSAPSKPAPQSASSILYPDLPKR